MSNQLLLTETVGTVRVLTMNRPEKRNALNTALTQSLLDALWAADKDVDIHAIVLTGHGQDFCAGADFTEFQNFADAADMANQRAELTTRLHKAFRDIQKPVIVAAQGNMMGGGAGIAMAGDLLILSPEARIGYPEVKRGIVPAIVMANLAQQLGPKHAMEMILRGKPMDAARAEQLGVANYVVELENLKSFALEIAQEIAAHQSQAVCAIKSLFYQSLNHDFHEAIEKGQQVNVQMRSFKK